jgi:hypothetical protein
VQTPHRFRTKRQLWTYRGFGIDTHDSAEYRYVAGPLQRSKKPQQVRGLNRNYNHDLKNLFKSAATNAVARSGSLATVLPGSGKTRNLAGDGPSDRGAQDRRHHISDLEERSELRRRTSETTNSLSVSGKCHPSIPGIDFWRWSVGFLRRADSRVSLNCLRRHRVPRHQVSELILVPLGQSEKAMGLESPIESWLASDNRCACLFQNRLASSLICDETAREIPNRHTLLCGRPALRGTDTRASCLRTGAGCQDDIRSSERYFP